MCSQASRHWRLAELEADCSSGENDFAVVRVPGCDGAVFLRGACTADEARQICAALQSQEAPNDNLVHMIGQTVMAGRCADLDGPKRWWESWKINRSHGTGATWLGMLQAPDCEKKAGNPFIASYLTCPWDCYMILNLV